MNFFEIIAQTFAQSGFVAMTWQQGVMILVSFAQTSGEKTWIIRILFGRAVSL